MNQEAGSLDRLADIVVPESISWWPPAIGWWVLLSVLLLAVIASAFVLYRRWQRDAYRRQALFELQTANSHRQINQILKRTALQVFPRAEIASLTGKNWIQWLNKTPGCDFETIAEADESQRFRNAAIHWIKQHTAEKIEC